MKRKAYLLSLYLTLVLILGACASPMGEFPLVYEIPDTELSFSVPGPYKVGKTNNVDYEDPQRDNRKISSTICYPTVNGQPDTCGAPFPLIICDHKMFNKFSSHLASHGFVIVGIIRIDYHHPWDGNFLEQPLDYVFVPNQLADNPPETPKGSSTQTMWVFGDIPLAA